MSKRVFLIVLDSFGIGEAPDAHLFNDCGCNTLKSVSTSSEFDVPTLRKMGLFNIDGVDCCPGIDNPIASYGRLRELSMGKDTTIGHWEISGIISQEPLPTYPDGFPKEIIDDFSQKTGRQVICNKPYSGTKVINDYGQEHIDTGALIVYTSADSVFQIAAHEDVVPIKELYGYCETARDILTGKNGVGRVIARPFVGEKGNFTRTSNRHDFSIKPPAQTMLDCIKAADMDTIAVGKIYDIFDGVSITEHHKTKGNQNGMEITSEILKTDFCGLCFVNLVDFDMLYGHRRDNDGYAKALTDFDLWLSKFITTLHNEDILIITADHGCDPSFELSTDHTREYVPLIVYSDIVNPVNLSTRNGFCDIGKTICDYLGVKNEIKGTSFLEDII